MDDAHNGWLKSIGVLPGKGLLGRQGAVEHALGPRHEVHSPSLAHHHLQGAQLLQQVSLGCFVLLQVAWCREVFEASADGNCCGRLSRRARFSTTSSQVVEHCTRAALGPKWLRLWAFGLHAPEGPIPGSTALANTPRAPPPTGTIPSHISQCSPARQRT